jgi:uncharacterized protein (DUF302 family)
MSKKALIFGFSGILAGILLSFTIIYFSAQGIMLKEKSVNLSFAEADSLFQKTTIEKGWKIATIHDLQATMKKFDKDVKSVKVYELCHPEHAYKILSQDAERIVSSLMPCRISIYEKSDGKVYVSWMNTGLMGSVMEGVVPEVMSDASRESKEIIDVLLAK